MMADDAGDTDRTEYFSDAIIAIAATLLVVDLKPPRSENLAGATLWDALAHDSPSFVAFAVSFVFIGIAWAAHHDMFRYIRRTNHVLLILNLIFLMAIALQPFSTALIAEHYGKPTEMTAALVYYGILLSASLSYNAVWWYAVQGGLVSSIAPQTQPGACCRAGAARDGARGGHLERAAKFHPARHGVPLVHIAARDREMGRQGPPRIAVNSARRQMARGNAGALSVDGDGIQYD